MVILLVILLCFYFCSISVGETVDLLPCLSRLDAVAKEYFQEVLDLVGREDRPQYLDLDVEVQRGSNQRAATVVDLRKAGSILGPTLGTHQRALHAVMEEGGVIPTP